MTTETMLTLESIYTTNGHYDGSERAALLCRLAKQAVSHVDQPFDVIIWACKAALVGEYEPINRILPINLKPTPGLTHSQRVGMVDDQLVTALWKAAH